MTKGEDFFRDTNVRYLGYANEVGEAFRPVLPRALVTFSYKVAFGYVVADTFSKTWKMIRQDGRPTKVMVAAGDALIWQTLASVIIPGLTINRISHYSGIALKKYAPKLAPNMRLALVVGIGLASIPIIVKPIDKGVDIFMACTYRMIFGTTY